MENLAKRIEQQGPGLKYGVVTAIRGSVLPVLTDRGCYEAVPAVSCLVQPEKGDIVLLSADGGDKCYILSVLERPGQVNLEKTLLFDGQVSIHVHNGGFRLTTDEGLSLTSRESLMFASPQIEVDAHEGAVRIEKMSFTGKLLQAQIEKMKVIADTVDSLFRRAVQRLTSSYRYIKEHEEIQSASTRMLVDGTLTMQTKNTMHTAEGHIKIDAEQIHLG